MPVEEKKASFWEPQERKGKRGRGRRGGGGGRLGGILSSQGLWEN